jgi:hypothetical protein
MFQAWWPMEGSKLSGQWKGKTPFHLLPLSPQTFSLNLQSLLHIMPFCEGPDKKFEGFAKEKQKT